MQRAAQWPSANDFTFGDSLFDGGFGGAARAQPEGPQRTEIVLRLDRPEPADSLGGAAERIMTDALAAQALGGKSDGTSSGGWGAKSLR